MAREHRILAALEPTEMPVPRPIALCEDSEVTGSPFYVMEHVDGQVVANAEEAGGLRAGVRTALGNALVDTLALLHDIDVEAIGLGDLGRKGSYVERQLWRWQRQWEQARVREMPLLQEVHDELARRVPDQTRVALVHGDYRLDNAITGSDGQLRAVLDWELATLGEPLADLGLLLVYWVQPGEDALGLDAPSMAGGFPTRAELVERYRRATGEDRDVKYFMALGHWKLACINEGVHARVRAGALGASGHDPEVIALQATRRTVVAARILEDA
jgi:aminoglycoside phosphotransferase (APT) family kinase protein